MCIYYTSYYIYIIGILRMPIILIKNNNIILIDCFKSTLRVNSFIYISILTIPRIL